MDENVERDRINRNYRKIKNPNWEKYQPDMTGRDPEYDATLLDMLERLSTEGTLTIQRTFLPGRNPWHISYMLYDEKVSATGGGTSVRDALASVVTGMAERALKR